MQVLELLTISFDADRLVKHSRMVAGIETECLVAAGADVMQASTLQGWRHREMLAERATSFNTD